MLPEAKISYLPGYQECVYIDMSWCVHATFILVQMHVYVCFLSFWVNDCMCVLGCACEHARATIHMRRKNFTTSHAFGGSEKMDFS